MEGVAIPDISQLTVQTLRTILEKFAGNFVRQREEEEKRHGEVMRLLGERPTFTQTVQLFQSEPAPEYVHVSILQAVTKELREELSILSDRLSSQYLEHKQDKDQIREDTSEEFRRAKEANSELRHVLARNKVRSENRFIAEKGKMRSRNVMRAWVNVHRTVTKQRSFLKHFFQVAFRTRMGRKFADWKHTTFSIRLKNVEMNISRCSLISQDCQTQLAAIKEDFATVKDKKADQVDMARLQTIVDKIDINQAVERLQASISSKFDELTKERRALEYRMKESFAVLDQKLSTKLTDTSLDPLREGIKVTISAVQELDKRLIAASETVAAIDLKSVTENYDLKLTTIEEQLVSISLELEKTRDEATLKNYSELVSARPLHQQGCLSCGHRGSVGKVPGLLGSDMRLYKGDSQHNNIAGVSKQRQNSAASDIRLEYTGHKPSLSLTTEVGKLPKPYGTPRRRGQFSIAPQITPTNGVSPLKLMTASTPHERDVSDSGGGHSSRLRFRS